MENYFIKLGAKEEGPFTLEELKEKKLTNEYQIWKDGMDNWKNVQVIKELQDFILKLPPKSNSVQNEILNSKKQNEKLFYYLVIGIAIVIFFLLGGFRDNYDITESYPGIGSGYASEAATQLRFLFATLSLVLSSIISGLIYYYKMMNVYKNALNKEKK